MPCLKRKKKSNETELVALKHVIITSTKLHKKKITSKNISDKIYLQPQKIKEDSGIISQKAVK